MIATTITIAAISALVGLVLGAVLGQSENTRLREERDHYRCRTRALENEVTHLWYKLSVARFGVGD
jgi:hypothetical protein